jgi:protein MpaA
MTSDRHSSQTWVGGRFAAMIVLALAVVLAAGNVPAQAAKPAVIERRTIGHSVDGRPIRAWHLGEKRRGVETVVLIAQMHGDEQKVANILTSLRDGKKIRGVNLWVVPRYNPDGRVRDRRHNARGVDLNRNYPASWKRTKGYYNSGRKPASEPETRAMMAFLRKVNPDYVLSFHQPLHGVDTLNPYKKFSKKVARELHLPRKRFDCNGGCHGTMTMWFNRNFDGKALTVEYGSHPKRKYLRGTAARRVLNIFDAHR